MKPGIHFVNFNLGEGATSLTSTRRGGSPSSGNGWSRSSPSSIRPARSTGFTTPDGKPGATLLTCDQIVT